MPRPYVGEPFSLRLPPCDRALLDRVAALRRGRGWPPAATTPAAVLRDLIRLTIDDTPLEELIERLT